MLLKTEIGQSVYKYLTLWKLKICNKYTEISFGFLLLPSWSVWLNKPCLSVERQMWSHILLTFTSRDVNSKLRKVGFTRVLDFFLHSPLLLNTLKYIHFKFDKSNQNNLNPSLSSDFNCNLSFNDIFPSWSQPPEVTLLVYEMHFHGT